MRAESLAVQKSQERVQAEALQRATAELRADHLQRGLDLTQADVLECEQLLQLRNTELENAREEIQVAREAQLAEVR